MPKNLDTSNNYDPMSAFQGAQTIGPSQVGERYMPTDNMSFLDVLRKLMGSNEVPKSVLAQDPYGINAWLKGAGNIPGVLNVGGLSLNKMTGGQPIYHGTQNVFERFDPRLADRSDVLGSFTHFAENPAYADQFATGGIKNRYSLNQSMIAAKPEAKNVLDLTNPNLEDLNVALAAVNNKSKSKIIDTVRKQSNPLKELSYQLKTHFSLHPQEFDKTPFDGIKYDDAGASSYAIPSKTPIKSFSGADMSPKLDTSPSFYTSPEGVTVSR